MREPSYGRALAQGWRVVWHHKSLWVLGLLSLPIGHFGLNAFVGQLLSFADSDLFANGTAWWPQTWPILHLESNQEILWFIWLVIILSSLAVFVIAAGIFAQGAIIAASGEWFRKHKDLHVVRAWRKGVKHFWRLLIVDIFQKILLAAVFFATTILLRQTSSATVGGLLLTVLISTIGLLLAVVISSVTIYTAGYVVEGELPLLESFSEGWRLFDRHLLVSVEMSIVFLLLNIVMLAVIFFGGVLLLTPPFLLLFIGGSTGGGGLIVLGVVMGVFLMISFIAFVGALFNAFTISSWMYLFMKMHHEGVRSRILHWLGL